MLDITEFIQSNGNKLTLTKAIVYFMHPIDYTKGVAVQGTLELKAIDHTLNANIAIVFDKIEVMHKLRPLIPMAIDAKITLIFNEFGDIVDIEPV